MMEQSAKRQDIRVGEVLRKLQWRCLDDYAMNPLEDGGRSSVGRAPVCGTGCRGFEPRRPPHHFLSRLAGSFTWSR